MFIKITILHKFFLGSRQIKQIFSSRIKLYHFVSKVVAVEPNLETVHHIQKSAQLSGTTDKITVVNNGISNERTMATIHVSIRARRPHTL